jgi:hypothetical protein
MSRSQSATRHHGDVDGDVDVVDQTTIEVEFDTAPVIEREAEPVFAAAAAYRPITVSVALAVLIVVGYGAYGVVSLFLPGGTPEALSVATAPEHEIIATAPMPPVPELCERVDVTTYVDADGNGHMTTREIPLPDMDVTVRGRGLGGAGTTGDDGTYSIVLPSAPMTVAATPRPGLWPGPRLPVHAGEAATLGDSCDATVGFVPVMEHTVVPLVSFDGPVLSRLVIDPNVPREDFGVQLHGRIWTDVDGDGAFTVHDRGVSDTRLQILDGGGDVLSEVTTTAGGLYSFANLQPHTTYELRLSDSELDVEGARVMGESRSDAWETMWLRTGDPGLAIWGADFQLGAG